MSQSLTFKKIDSIRKLEMNMDRIVNKFNWNTSKLIFITTNEKINKMKYTNKFFSDNRNNRKKLRKKNEYNKLIRVIYLVIFSLFLFQYFNKLKKWKFVKWV